MNATRKTALAVAVTALTALCTAASARADFAAIAYSPNTGHVGYSYNASTRSAAELAALDQCNRSDAEVLVWAENAYCALAVGEDGSYGYAWGTTRAIAESIALDKCLDVGGVRPRIVVSIFSGE